MKSSCWMKMSAPLKTVALCLVGVILSQSRLLADAPFTDLISFGDSLTDVGNVAGVTTPGYSPVINGYYEETHFSDNILWNETLADYWGLPSRTPGRIAFGSLSAQTSGNTWAWGGSEAGSGTVQPTGVTQPIPNLLTETANFLANRTPVSTELYSIWSGADNLLVGGKFGPQAAADAVAAVKTAMQDLEAAGARNFLIFNMPRMGDTPDAQSGGPVSIAAANEFSVSYNDALNVAIDELRHDASFEGTIYLVDDYSLLVNIVDSVKTSGTYTPDFFVPGDPVTITNVTDEGLTYFNNTGTDPSNYLFWDAVHPTTQGHQIVAGLVLQSIPEPGPIFLLLLGTLAVVAYRRRGCTRLPSP